MGGGRWCDSKAHVNRWQKVRNFDDCHPAWSARKEFPTRFLCDSPPHRAQMRRALGTPGRVGAESKDLLYEKELARDSSSIGVPRLRRPKPGRSSLRRKSCVRGSRGERRDFNFVAELTELSSQDPGALLARLGIAFGA